MAVYTLDRYHRNALMAEGAQVHELKRRGEHHTSRLNNRKSTAKPNVTPTITHSTTRLYAFRASVQEGGDEGLSGPPKLRWPPEPR